MNVMKDFSIKGTGIPSFLETIGFSLDKKLADFARYLYQRDVVDFRSKDRTTMYILLCPKDYVLIYMNGGYIMTLPEDKMDITGTTLFAGYIKSIEEIKLIIKMIGYETLLNS